MKKTILACLSLFLTIGLINVNAQNDISFGLKGEMNLSNFILKDLNNLESNMKVGPNLGAYMRIDLHENFAIQPEVLFFFRQSEMGIKTNTSFLPTISTDDTFKQWGMQIPVYALGKLPVGNGNFYLGVGPFVGVGFDARLKDADINLYDEIVGKIPMQRWDVGIATMLGYEFKNGIQLNASYQYGFINQLDALKDVSNMNMQALNIGIGYTF